MEKAQSDDPRREEYFKIMQWLHYPVRESDAQKFEKYFYERYNLGAIWKDVSEGKAIPKKVEEWLSYPYQQKF